MATIGLELGMNRLVLTAGRKFSSTLQLTEPRTYLPVDWPDGDLYIEFADGVPTQWNYTISGALASLAKTSTDVGNIAAQTRWQLVFVATGDTSGGVPVGRGITVIQK